MEGSVKKLARRNSFFNREETEQRPNTRSIDNHISSKVNTEDLEQKDETYQIETLRIAVKHFMNNSFFGWIYDWFLLVLSILSSVEFMCQTYLDAENPEHHHILRTIAFVEMAVAGLFGMDWALSYFIADHKIYFIKSFYSMVDLLTVIPIYATYGLTRPLADEIFVNFGAFVVYVLFALNTTRILRALRVSKKLKMIEDAVTRCVGEMALTFAVMLLFNAALMQYLELEEQPLPFHTWIYFMWVTTATVGYGDITPHTPLGRFATMAMIGCAIILVPMKTNELIEKMQMQSIYARAHYRPKNKRSTHVLICGDIKSTSLAEFFDELFHEDHQNEDIHAVLLQPDPPSKDLQSRLMHPAFGLKVTYLQGSALVDKDLSRAMAETAVAVFVMTNKFSSKPDEEDAKTILQQFSIRRFIYNRNPSMETMFCIQLVRPENRRHLVNTATSENLDIVACMNEIKMGVVAKAVLAPGSSTLIMNLLASFADDLDEESDGKVGEIDENESHGNWIDEYRQGCDWEIYTSELSQMFAGWKFAALSEYLYEKLGIVLFGLQAEETKQNKTVTRTLLNPGDFKIPSNGEMKLQALVMAKNKFQSDLSFDGKTFGESSASPPDNWQPPQPQATSLGAAAPAVTQQQPLLPNRPRKNTLPIDAVEESKADVATPQEDHYHRRSGHHHHGHNHITTNTKPVLPLDSSNTGISPNNSVSQKIGEKKLYPWQELYRKYGDSRPDAFTHQEAIQKAEDHHLRENYYIRPVPADLADVTIKTSVTEELPVMTTLNNHIIIMGKSLNNLYDLIRPLRARYLGQLRFIVILYAEQIPHSVWQRISIFEGILVVRGSSLEEADMRRAGIFQAQKVIVLADAEDSSSTSQNPTGSTSGSGGTADLESLVDADAIFSYQCVRRMNEHAQVVVEIVRQSSICYLDNESSINSVSDIHYRFTPQFASGALFSSSLLDTIVCQAFYNPLIIKVINKMVGGVEHRDSNELTASGPALGAKRGVLSITASSLYQISIPEDLESRTYGALYKHVAKRGMVPLGIFRGLFREMKTGPKSNKLPYVFTNPPKDTELFSCDKIFVLSQKPPSGERGKADKVKEIQLYESFRKRKNVVDHTAENVVYIREEIKALSQRNEMLEAQLNSLKQKFRSYVHDLTVVARGGEEFATGSETAEQPCLIATTLKQKHLQANRSIRLKKMEQSTLPSESSKISPMRRQESMKVSSSMKLQKQVSIKGVVNRRSSSASPEKVRRLSKTFDENN